VVRVEVLDRPALLYGFEDVHCVVSEFDAEGCEVSPTLCLN